MKVSYTVFLLKIAIHWTSVRVFIFYSFFHLISTCVFTKSSFSCFYLTSYSPQAFYLTPRLFGLFLFVEGDTRVYHIFSYVIQLWGFLVFFFSFFCHVIAFCDWNTSLISTCIAHFVSFCTHSYLRWWYNLALLSNTCDKLSNVTRANVPLFYGWAILFLKSLGEFVKFSRKITYW